MSRESLNKLSKQELIELVLKMQDQETISVHDNLERIASLNNTSKRAISVLKDAEDTLEIFSEEHISINGPDTVPVYIRIALKRIRNSIVILSPKE